VGKNQQGINRYPRAFKGIWSSLGSLENGRGVSHINPEMRSAYWSHTPPPGAPLRPIIKGGPGPLAKHASPQGILGRKRRGDPSTNASHDLGSLAGKGNLAEELVAPSAGGRVLGSGPALDPRGQD
jgi:hypothetical protein